MHSFNCFIDLAWERIYVDWPGRGEVVELQPTGPDLSPILVPCRWRASHSRVKNSWNVFMLLQGELDTMSADQFVWRPYSNKILGD